MSGSPRHKLRTNHDRTAIADDFAAIFGDDFAARASVPQDIPIELIDPSPRQARQEFKNLEELAQSMREHGFTSRLRIRQHPNDPQRYQLVYGERRLRAAKLAGITMVPCDVAQHTDAELREIGLTENLVREDLNPLEEARAFEQALDERDASGQAIYTVRSLASRIGKSAGYIDKRLALLRVPHDVQQLVVERPDTVVVARDVAKLETAEERAPLIAGLLNRTLTSRDVQSVVDEAGKRPVMARVGVTTSQSLRHDIGRTVDEQVTDHQGRGVASELGDHPLPSHAAQPPASYAGRASTRARLHVEQRLNAVGPAVRDALPSLNRADRDLLITMIVDHLIPELGAVVTALQQEVATGHA